MNNNIIGVYGTDASPFQIGSTLTHLNVSHSTIISDYNLGYAQPAWVGIIPSINYLSRYRNKHDKQILFISDSLAGLKHCNIPILRIDENATLTDAIKKALVFSLKYPTENWTLQQQKPTIDDYVEYASNPSYLNFIQTALYKISNYPLRKEVQVMVIQYLNSDIKLPILMQKLSSNLKLAELQTLLADPRAKVLRNAVAAFKAGMNIETVAKEFNVETFEIRYVQNSATRTKELSSG